MTLAVSDHRHRHQPRFVFEPREVEQTGPFAETVVCLLQRNDVGAHLTNDARCPVGVEFAVGADAFVDVVGGNDHFGAAYPLARRRHRLPHFPGTDRQEHGLREAASVSFHACCSSSSNDGSAKDRAIPAIASGRKRERRRASLATPEGSPLRRKRWPPRCAPRSRPRSWRPAPPCRSRNST